MKMALPLQFTRGLVCGLLFYTRGLFQMKKSCPVSALPLSTVRLISGLKLIMPQMPKVPVLARRLSITLSQHRLW